METELEMMWRLEAQGLALRNTLLTQELLAWKREAENQRGRAVHAEAREGVLKARLGAAEGQIATLTYALGNRRDKDWKALAEDALRQLDRAGEGVTPEAQRLFNRRQELERATS